MKVKVISLPYIFQVLYVLCFTRPRYQVSVYRTIGPLVCPSELNDHTGLGAIENVNNIQSTEADHSKMLQFIDDNYWQSEAPQSLFLTYILDPRLSIA